MEHAQSVIQVGPEGARLHQFFQGRIGRRHHAHIGASFFTRADGTVTPFLKDAQEGNLGLARQTVDLVQEKGAFLGLGDQTFAAAAGVREGAALMAEQFILKKRVRQRAAVDRRERESSARPEIMQSACGQFLAGAGFALDKNGGSVLGDARQPADGFDEQGRPAHESSEGQFATEGINYVVHRGRGLGECDRPGAIVS